MIIIKLRGGLGNQLFQYALGRALAEKNKVQLGLDLSVYYNSIERADYTIRGYELGIFNINAKLLLPPKIQLLNNTFSKRVSNLLQKSKIRFTKNIIREKHFHFDPSVLLAKDNSYLNGYWHSERYFKEVEEKIRQELTLKNPLENHINELSAKIQSSNSVSLHIRRGDYLTNTWAQKTFHLLDLNYYESAVKKIEEETGELHCFIFSDEQEWVQKNINLPNQVTFIACNRNYEDLYLMSHCKHHVIANSSFSWWGAWLNSNDNKKVIAPKNWFKDPNINTSTLVPENWIRI